MDTHTPTDTSVTAYTHHALLWIGPDEVLVTKTHEYIQRQLCPHDGCSNCVVCKQITQHQHHTLLWLEPEKNYTLDMIDQLCNTMAYALTSGTSFFFVLQRADTLSVACSNRLLKALEEPPIGYQFILLAQRTDTLLPTIRSRCVMHTWYEPASTNTHWQIIEYFTYKKVASATEFLAFIDSSLLNEYQSNIIMDTILNHWVRAYQKARLKNDVDAFTHIYQVIVQLYAHIEKPPMPGSTKLFWKNLFLQMYG